MKNIIFLMLFCVLGSVNAQISRSTIMSNANSYSDASGGYVWSATNANKWVNVTCTGNGTTRQIFYAAPPNGCVVTGTNYGMPYSWGGFSTTAENNNAMINGKSAGDICSANGGGCSGNGAGPTCSGGMDCSGFVSRCFGYTVKKNCDGLADVSTPIKIECVRQGDIFNKTGSGSHVRIYNANIGGSKPYQVVEESGTKWRVQYNNWSTSDLNAYIPRVFNNTPSCGSRPSGLFVVSKTATTAKLQWTASGASNYDYYLKKSSEALYSVYTSYAYNPVTFTGLTPNTTYNFKVSSNCSNGTWGISDQVLTFTTPISFAVDDEVGEIQVTGSTTGTDIISSEWPSHENICIIIANGKEITATNVAEGSTYILVNTLGQICCQGKSRNGSIECEAENPGIYFISIIDSLGNKCTQKIIIP